MTSLSFIECCQLLAVDPKTLRQWLAQAQMSLHAHPSDARIKCLTSEQVFVLVNLHDRVFQTSVPTAFACSTPSEAESQKPWMAAADADLRAKLAHLETQIVTLQAQLTDLTLQLLREREHRTEQRQLALEAERSSTCDHSLVPRSGTMSSVSCQSGTLELVCHPTEKRNHLIPLIEYGARGQYVLLSPEEGELPITPDSPEWFAWLASLSSFRFVGQQGRFSARRVEDERFDFLWSRDMLMHVPALPAALTECARVLKSAGSMLVYTTVATGRMEPKEAAWLYASFGLVPESMDEGSVEAAFQVAGFQMRSKEPLGSELMEWVEEHEGRVSRELMRLARMLRKPEYYRELLGASRYEVALANYHWALYILLGKLSPTLYVLRKNASS